MMGWQIKAFAIKVDDLSLISKIYKVEGEI